MGYRCPYCGRPDADDSHVPCPSNEADPPNATMHELMGDDGGAYVPDVVTYTETVATPGEDVHKHVAEVTEAYQSWRETGTAALKALLVIWRALEPAGDRKHLTFGDDPQRVVDETLRALRDRTDAGSGSCAAGASVEHDFPNEWNYSHPHYPAGFKVCRRCGHTIHD